jgi:hypothetical protein
MLLLVAARASFGWVLPAAETATPNKRIAAAASVAVDAMYFVFIAGRAFGAITLTKLNLVQSVLKKKNDGSHASNMKVN